MYRQNERGTIGPDTPVVMVNAIFSTNARMRNVRIESISSYRGIVGIEGGKEVSGVICPGVLSGLDPCTKNTFPVKAGSTVFAVSVNGHAILRDGGKNGHFSGTVSGELFQQKGCCKKNFPGYCKSCSNNN